MAKVTVSSKELNKALWQIKSSDYSFQAAAHAHGSALFLLEGDRILTSFSCLIDYDFYFKFQDEASFRRFKEFLSWIPEQPITLEDGHKLSVTATAQFR